MSWKEITRRHVVGGVLSEAGWNHGVNNGTKAVVAVIREGKDQIFVGLGNGWSLQLPEKQSPKETFTQITHLQQGWTWNSWFGDSITNAGKIMEGDIIVSNNKTHQRMTSWCSG